MNTFETVVKEHLEWTSATFPKGTSKGALLHAQREIVEVMEEIDGQDIGAKNRLVTEYADVICCIVDSINREGIAISDVIAAMHNKLQINKSRTWRDNGDGSYSHIKNTPHA